MSGLVDSHCHIPLLSDEIEVDSILDEAKNNNKLPKPDVENISLMHETKIVDVVVTKNHNHYQQK